MRAKIKKICTLSYKYYTYIPTDGQIRFGSIAIQGLTGV